MPLWDILRHNAKCIMVKGISTTFVQPIHVRDPLFARAIYDIDIA